MCDACTRQLISARLVRARELKRRQALVSLAPRGARLVRARELKRGGKVGMQLAVDGARLVRARELKPGMAIQSAAASGCPPRAGT